jgi:hypothetical protein
LSETVAADAAEHVRTIALALPGTAEARSRGIRSFTVRNRLFLRLMQDGTTLVVRTDPYERAHLLATEPGVFHVTRQIRDHPWVFARLPDADPQQLRGLVEDAWRRVAPRRRVDEFDAALRSSRSGASGR